MSAGALRGRAGRREGWGALLLGLLALALLLVAVLSTAPPPDDRPFDLDSPQPMGLLALRLWLEELDYSVGETSRVRFAVPAEADLLFVFPGAQPYTADEAEPVRAWVEEGGTLVLVQPDAESRAALAGLALETAPLLAVSESLRQAQPLLPEAAAAWPGGWFSGATVFDLEQGDAVPVLATQAEQPTAAVRAVGAGWVWLLSDFHLLTNQALAQPEQAALATALLRAVPEGGRILFDTYHLYGARTAGRIQTLQDWLYRTALGRALLFALLLGGFYWLSAGRRLGPPVPAPETLRRREAAEYVRALASLQRRAHTAPAVALHHRQRLKSALARTRALDPRSDDLDFTRRLRAHSAVDPTLDAATLAEVERLLAALQNPKDEQALVQAVAAVDAFLTQRRNQQP